jgi:hypothetical protein
MKKPLPTGAVIAIIAVVALLVLGGAYMAAGNVGGVPETEKIKVEEATQRYKDMGIPAQGGGPPMVGGTEAEKARRGGG